MKVHGNDSHWQTGRMPRCPGGGGMDGVWQRQDRPAASLEASANKRKDSKKLFADAGFEVSFTYLTSVPAVTCLSESRDRLVRVASQGVQAHVDGAGRRGPAVR